MKFSELTWYAFSGQVYPTNWYHNPYLYYSSKLSQHSHNLNRSLARFYQGEHQKASNQDQLPSCCGFFGRGGDFGGTVQNEIVQPRDHVKK